MPKQSSVQINFVDYSSLDELDPMIKDLLMKAKEISNDAYAPYSSFKVGAAVLMEDGSVFLGNNQENRAFPSGLCAERVAIFSAGSMASEKKIKAIAIYAPMEEQISPCGSCRQVILEYEIKQDQKLPIFLMNKGNEVRKFNAASDLLPFGFKYNNFPKR